jgi:hypothetical protein
MKYILSVLFLFFFFSGFTQIYQEMPQYGYRANRMAFDSTLQIPTVCGVPTLKSVVSVNKKAALAFDSCNNRFYTYNPKTLTWSQVSGGGATPLQDVLTAGKDFVDDSGDTLRLYQYENVNGIDRIYPLRYIDNGEASPSQILMQDMYVSNQKSELKMGNFGNSEPTYFQLNTGELVIQQQYGTGYREMQLDYDGLKIYKDENYFTNLNFLNSNNNANYEVHMPIQIETANDTLTTLQRFRLDTANKWVNNITRTSGKDSIIFFIGSTRYAIKDSVGTNPAPVGYYGAFQDNTTQTAVSANTAYPVKLNTTDLTNGVSVVNDGSGNPTRITLANTGIYNIQFSLQLEKTGGSGNFIVDIWVRKNGVDIPSTTGKIVLTGSANASPVVAAWNYVLDLTAGDYVQLMWSTSNNNAVILASAAASPHPSVPSAILTVTQQSGIMAGTGITAINSLTGSAQTLVTGTDSTDFKIVSTGTTHKFNLPTASATNRGALSSANWSTFNSKISPSDTATMLTPYLRKVDTTNRFVNNISRTVGKDSIIFNIGSTRYAIKDSVGGGGGSAAGSTGNVQYNNGGAFAGSNNLFWDNTNSRLGIGTASPTLRLDVTGTGTANGQSLVRFTNPTTFNLNLALNSTGATGNTNFGFTVNDVTQGAVGWDRSDSSIQFWNAIANASFVGMKLRNNGNTSFLKVSDGTENVRFVSSTGNVLIGTTTDAGYKLDVNGTARAVTSLQTPTLLGNTTSGANLTLQSTSNATKGKILFGTSAYDEVNNRLGIGNSSPSYNLDVSGLGRIIRNSSSSNTFIALNQSTTASNNFLFGQDSTTNFVSFGYYPSGATAYRALTAKTGYVYASTGSDALSFSTLTNTQPIKFCTDDWTERMRIYGGGNISIGYGNTPTDAGYKFDVNGTARAVTSLQTPTLLGNTTSGANLTLQSTSNATKGKILFGTSAYDEVNNRLGIGNSSPAYKLDCTLYNGNAVRLVGGVGYNNGFIQTAYSNFLFSTNTYFDTTAGSFKYEKAGYAASVQAESHTGNILFNTAPSGLAGANATLDNRMIVFNGGNVAIGTNPTNAGYRFDVNGTARVQGALNFNPTNTASGTTGNQTINKASGTVNIAAAGTTVTVTNSLVSASSIVYAVIRTNDATATIKNVVPSAGSFVINLGAATTAETSIGFFVIN